MRIGGMVDLVIANRFIVHPGLTVFAADLGLSTIDRGPKTLTLPQ
jgi:hypothetical protein